MVCTWPRMKRWLPRGSSFWILSARRRDFVGDRAEIASIDRGVDIDHRLSIVVGNRGGTRDGRSVSQDFQGSAA